MQILFMLPDDVADEFTAFCHTKKLSRSEMLRLAVYKLLNKPVQPARPRGRPILETDKNSSHTPAE